MARKILVTGAAGRIGTIVREHLGGKYDLAGLDRIAVEGVDSHVADLSDLNAIRPAFEGQEIVVHLGADPNGSAPWDSVLPNNIVGVYNVLGGLPRGGRQPRGIRQHQPRRGFLP